MKYFGVGASEHIEYGCVCVFVYGTNVIDLN
jgi:hypothetical protein